MTIRLQIIMRRLFRRDRNTVRQIASAVMCERVDLDALSDIRHAIMRGLQACGNWNDETERELDRWILDYEGKKPKPARAGGWVF